MNKELISVVIPIFNVEKNLDDCIKSVINQTYKDIEIILVDDGSKDNSGKICDKYAIRDKRIKVIHKKNEGVAIARNMGVKEANGKYITFIDADDYVEEDYIKILYELCKDTDISIVGTIDEDTNKKEISRSKIMKKKITGKEAIKQMLFTNRFFGWTCWTKMYKLDIIKNVRFKERVKIAEDVQFMYDILKQANIVNVDTSYWLYHYVLNRKGSATEVKFNDDRKIEMQIYKNMKEDMERIMSQDGDLIRCVVFKKSFISDFFNIKNF